MLFSFGSLIDINYFRTPGDILVFGNPFPKHSWEGQWFPIFSPKLFSKNKVHHDLSLSSLLHFSLMLGWIHDWVTWNYLKFLKHGILFYPIILYPRLRHTIIHIWSTLPVFWDPSQVLFSRNLPHLCLLGRVAHSVLHIPSLLLTSSSAPATLFWRSISSHMAPHYKSSLIYDGLVSW